jgi:hypothetical protein
MPQVSLQWTLAKSPQAKIGITGEATLRYQAINSVIALIAQFLCILFIDHFGRRWPLILGNLGNMVTFIWGTILLAKFPPGSPGGGDGPQWGFILSTWVYNFSFSATCGPLSWIIPAEVFDTHTRSKGVSIATMTSFAFNTMIGQVTDVAMKNVGYKYYYLFIVSSLLSPQSRFQLESCSWSWGLQICNFTNAVFFWLFLPETARLPLEEMNYLFTHAPWIVPGSKKTEYISHDLETRAAEIQEKQAVVSHHDGDHAVDTVPKEL